MGKPNIFTCWNKECGKQHCSICAWPLEKAKNKEDEKRYKEELIYHKTMCIKYYELKSELDIAAS